MKKFNHFHLRVLLSLSLMVILLGISACEDPDPKVCRITQFQWSGIDYSLVYTGDRLDQFVATNSHIDLTYDENDQLFSAEFFAPGDVTPSLIQEFKHGPDGINQIDEFRGGEHSRYLISYGPSGLVNQIITQEFSPGTTTVTLESTGTFTFNSNDNLIQEYNASIFIWSDYTISEYDKARNPFMILAEAVNHPKFFPIGRYVRFPLTNFNVSMGNRFSANNPLLAQYQLPSLPANHQEFSYIYDGLLPTTLQWDDDVTGSMTTVFYRFAYDCM